MLPLSKFSKNNLSKIKFVLTDIDETLTENGRIPYKSLKAMEMLQKNNIFVVPVTGRPAGWCDHIARMWPVDGIIGENGAFYFFYEKSKKKMKRRFWKSEKQRKEDQHLLQNLSKKILLDIKGCKIASDQPYRETDLAIDISEDVTPLSKSKIEKILKFFHKAGAHAKVSSIHINGWFGHYDKLAMTRIFFEEIFQKNIDTLQEQIVFCGDSPNDEPMFDFFQNSVGVANVLDFNNEIRKLPTWITKNRSSEGFFELAEAII